MIPLKDNFIFSKTLELFPALCKQLIELILNINVKHIDFPEREKVIEIRTDSNGIRLDVYVEDDQNRSFDIEMQVDDSDNISKRMRYYQGLIDVDKLKHGQHYSALVNLTLSLSALSIDSNVVVIFTHLGNVVTKTTILPLTTVLLKSCFLLKAH